MKTPEKGATVGSRTMLGPHGFGSKVELQQQVEAKLERWRSGEVESQAKVEKEEMCSFQLPQGSCLCSCFNLKLLLDHQTLWDHHIFWVIKVHSSI